MTKSNRLTDHPAVVAFRLAVAVNKAAKQNNTGLTNKPDPRKQDKAKRAWDTNDDA